jgi:HlyD family secretion protein
VAPPPPPLRLPLPAADAGGPSASVIAGPGRVEPVSEEIEVAPELSGKLAEVLVDEGDVVAAGQVLARLEADDYHARETAAEARLAVAEAERLRLTNGARPAERREAEAVATQAAAALDHARIEVERQRRLYEGGVIPRETLDRVERDWQVATARRTETAERLATVDADARLDELARADAAVALARASLAEARALVRKTVVRAPIDGVVLRRHRQTGESVSLEGPTATIVTVADTRTLRVRADVDERDVAALRLGQPAWVTAVAYGDRRFPGRVVRIGSMLGRKNVRTDEPSERVDTKVLETLVALDPGASLPVGLRVEVFIAR